MNLFIFNFKASSLRCFAFVFLSLCLIFLTTLAMLAYLVDPYDSGRSTLFKTDGVRIQGPRTAHASRGRDPQFEGVIIGNSHIQLLSPERLTAQTKIPFVSLTVPGSGPKEQLVLLDWFLRHRTTPPKVVIIGLDGYWCTADAQMPNWKPFPFWLYSASKWEYIRGLLSMNALEETFNRLRFWRKPTAKARKDGYWDYEQDYQSLKEAVDGPKEPRLEERRETITPNISGHFPAAEALKTVLATLPKTTGIFLVRPPVYITGLPLPDSAEAKTDAACLHTFRQLADIHPQVAVLNWREIRNETRDQTLFFDHTHYRRPLAEALEEQMSGLIKAFRIGKT
jgi:hypothetical protein